MRLVCFVAICNNHQDLRLGTVCGAEGFQMQDIFGYVTGSPLDGKQDH